MPTQQIEFEPATLHYLWRNERSRSSFRTAVSLHSHTLHSREALDFVPRISTHSFVLRRILAVWDARYRARSGGRSIDYSRAWWTPPVCARQALDLESHQIESQLGVMPIVSITDHDNMDAARLLSMTSEGGECIWSVEWSVPYRGTVLHAGIHNIAATEAEAKLEAMNRFTEEPVEGRLQAILEWLASDRDCLVVLNHPLWDEKAIGSAEHRAVVNAFLGNYGALIHALELNGLRSWRENSQVLALAGEFGIKAISGGDRHGSEPNAVLNLTHAETFAEFVTGIRNGEKSEILFMPQYRQSITLRMLHNVLDVVGEQPAHSLGWTHVCDRVFHCCDDGSHKSLTQLLGGRVPRPVRALTGVAHMMRRQPVRSALRLALGAQEIV